MTRNKTREGAAMIEAVIALPTFAVVLAATVYFHAFVANKQRIASSARATAWQAAMQGCSGSMPDGVLQNGGSLPHTDDVVNAANQHVDSDSIFPAIANIPLVGDRLSSLAPDGVLVTQTAAVPKPPILQFIEGDVATESAYVTCNERHRDPVHTVLSTLTSWLGAFF